jgi:hypothetical protein
MSTFAESSTPRASVLDEDLLAAFRADDRVRRALPSDHNLLGFHYNFCSSYLHCFPLRYSRLNTLTGWCEPIAPRHPPRGGSLRVGAPAQSLRLVDLGKAFSAEVVVRAKSLSYNRRDAGPSHIHAYTILKAVRASL